MATLPCVYCGRRPGTTDDHVPPKGLFPSPRPSNLVSVPCCSPCHRGFSKDDEYFRLALSMRWDTSEAAREPRDAAMRGLHRPQGRRFMRSFIRGVREVEVRSPAGLFVGRTGSYHVDLERLGKVAGRTARGLFFHHVGQRLSDDFEPVPYSGDGLFADARKEMTEWLRRTVLRNERHEVGEGVFEYWFQASTDVPDATVWVFRFYGSAEFVVLTLPRDRETGARTLPWSLTPYPYAPPIVPRLR